MSYPKSRIGKLNLKKADLLRDLDPTLAQVETELGAITSNPNLITTRTTDTVTTLQALTGRLVGDRVWVTSRRRLYTAVTSGSGTVTGSGVDWVSLPETSSKTWLTQATWFIDGVAGNDDNSGIDQAHPIKTGRELYERLRAQKWVWAQSVNITVLSNIDELILDFEFDTTARVLTVNGQLTTILETTVASWTAITGNNSARITATGLADWTPHLWKRMRIVGGARDNTVAFAAEVNPDGVGVATTATIPFITASTTFNITGVAPAPGDTLRIESFPTIGRLYLRFSSTLFLTVSPIGLTFPINFVGLDMPYLDMEFLTSYTYVASFLGCSIGLTRTLSTRSENQPPTSFRGCLITTGFIAETSTTACIFRPLPGRTQIGVMANNRWFTSGDLFQGCQLYLDTGARASSSGSLGVQNSPTTSQVLVGSGALLSLTSTLYGKTASAIPGVVIRPHGKMTRGTTLPTITGAAGDFRMGLPGADVTISWASISSEWHDGRQRGTGTLGAGGTVTIAIPYWDPTKQSVQLTYSNPAAGATPLYAPSASQTTTQLVVNGNPADATSTFNWFISDIGYGQFLERVL